MIEEGRHVDGKAYRCAAVRECFEESGILLAKKGDGEMLEVSLEERTRARKEIHEGRLNFGEWVEGLGGVVDCGSFSPSSFGR